MSLPVLLLTYRRITTTLEVLNRIIISKPSRLYVVSNAPNPHEPTDIDAVRKVRLALEAIPSSIPKRILLRDKHLPVARSIPYSIDWFFEHETAGIILEDDCLPNSSFFQYCNELIPYYQNNPRVMAICGTNFSTNNRSTDNSYFFSRIPLIWGWATWKTAWKHYDHNMTLFNTYSKNKEIRSIFPDFYSQYYWTNKLKENLVSNKPSWDYKWCYSIWKNNGMCCIPGKNLVTNTGFGVGAEFCADPTSAMSNLSTYNMQFPLSHPADITPNRALDYEQNRTAFQVRKYYFKHLWHKVNTLLHVVLALTITRAKRLLRPQSY